MSATLLYSYPTDNVISTVSVVTASAEDPDYPSANLYDLNLAKPAKLTASSGNWVFDFGSAKRIDWVAFGPHNLAGGSASLQGNASDSWGAPTLSASITIPANLNDGQSVNPWKDLTGVSGYTVSGFRYWRLVVATTGDPAAIGEVWLAAQKRTIRNLRVGVSFPRSRPVVEHRTEYGISTIYDLGVLYRRVTGEWLSSTTAGADLLAWWHACKGRVLMTPIVVDETINEALFVRFTADLSEQRVSRNISRVALDWDEVGRGLHL